jgi:hypothetical protein
MRTRKRVACTRLGAVDAPQRVPGLRCWCWVARTLFGQRGKPTIGLLSGRAGVLGTQHGSMAPGPEVEAPLQCIRQGKWKACQVSV